MYENQTFKVILARMLAAVPDDVDKRPGGTIYNALAPAATELADMYAELNINLRQASAQTASGIYLDLRVADYGVYRKEATKAIQKGLFFDGSGSAFDVPIGSRYSAGNFNFVVTSKISTGQYQLQAETAGTGANTAFGSLLPIDYVAGLSAATISELLIPGTDTQTDDELRKEYMETVQEPSTSGNIADYRRWALEVDGVGDVVVVPLWAGPGTVKIFLLDANKQPASAPLVADVQAYISPTAGTGEGKAPIGVKVTAAAAPGVSVNVTATVVRNGTRTLAQIKADFETVLTEYLKGIAFSKDPSVKWVRVGGLLLDTAGVGDYSSLSVNGGTANIAIGKGSVAIKGTVTLIE